MKKITCLLSWLLITTSLHASTPTPSSVVGQAVVDQRVELLSIVFRLAERKEYCQSQFKLYTDRINAHFDKNKDHELIRFVKSIMDENGLAYDAVMSMAMNLDDKFNLRTDVTTSSLDARWSVDHAEKFVQLLKKFAKESQFNRFYKDNSDLYTEATKRFAPVYEQLDIKWYKAFYGQEPKERFKIIIGLGNGGANYGVSLNYKNQGRDVHAIMGAWNVDSAGMVSFNKKEYLPTLIHEFNHSFVNWLMEKHRETFQESGEKLFEVVGTKMKAQAYGNWTTMLNEALVRASVIKYMKDHNFDQREVDSEMKAQIDMGFIWIKALLNELDKYSAQRELYPTLDDYMPKLAEAYVSYAKIVTEMDDKRPRVTSIEEFANGHQKVDASLKTITINFDRPLLGKGYSVFYGSQGQGTFPKVEKIYYAKDNRAVVMEVSLEVGKEYQLVLKGDKFKSTDGIGIDDYAINFKTTVAK